MKPEAADYLEKAHTLLSEAASILAIHLHEAAGRTAYLGAFHARASLRLRADREDTENAWRCPQGIPEAEQG